MSKEKIDRDIDQEIDDYVESMMVNGGMSEKMLYEDYLEHVKENEEENEEEIEEEVGAITLTDIEKGLLLKMYNVYKSKTFLQNTDNDFNNKIKRYCSQIDGFENIYNNTILFDAKNYNDFKYLIGLIDIINEYYEVTYIQELRNHFEDFIKRGDEMYMEKNFVVEKDGKNFVFKRFVEALSFQKEVEKETGKKIAIMQKELAINSKYDLEKGALVMNQNEVNNEGIVMPEVSNEAVKSVWITIPRAAVGTEFELKDKNDKPHTYVFINMPEDESSRTSFSVLSKQVLPHPLLKDFCNIPISEYGLNLCHSVKIKKAPMAISGDTKVGQEYEWKRDDEINHMDQKEAVDYLTAKYCNINNKETKYLLLSKENCKEIISEEAKNKGKYHVKMPKYMNEHNGFIFAESNFIVNKVYALADSKMGGMRAIQCAPNAKFRVYGTDERYIDVKAKDLYEYNKEDFAKHKEQENNKESKEPNKYAEAIEKTEKETGKDTLKEDCAKIVSDIEKNSQESNSKENEKGKEKSNKGNEGRE